MVMAIWKRCTTLSYARKLIYVLCRLSYTSCIIKKTTHMENPPEWKTHLQYIRNMSFMWLKYSIHDSTSKQYISCSTDTHTHAQTCTDMHTHTHTHTHTGRGKDTDSYLHKYEQTYGYINSGQFALHKMLLFA